MRSFGWLVPLATMCAACTHDEPKRDTPPPGVAPSSARPTAAAPSASAAAPAAHECAAGGADNPDVETAAMLPRVFEAEGGTKYCLKAGEEIRAYGEKAKYNMDEVCTTAFDGECEVYKSFALKRVVEATYGDDAGKGINVVVTLSRFATPDGAYGLFTKRVVADRDPKGEGVPKPLEAGAAAAIGTGRAYLFRGVYLAELQYNSDSESPAQLAASSQKALGTLAKQLGDKLPGDKELPASAKALQSEGLIPNGIAYYPTKVPGFGAVGPAAFGFYEDGGARARVLSIVRSTEADAKSTFTKLKGAGKPVTGVGDEAVAAQVMLTEKDGPKVDFVVARKGMRIVGVGDEELVVKTGSKPLGEAALTERAKKLLDK